MNTFATVRRIDPRRPAIITPAGLLTLKRDVSTDGWRPMAIFFGELDNALSVPTERWQTQARLRPLVARHGTAVLQNTAGRTKPTLACSLNSRN